MNKLYRHFDIDGNLLYIGISVSFMVRLSSHKQHSSWFNSIARTEYTPYPTRKAAALAEKEAIKAEKPLYNIMHNNLSKEIASKILEITPDTGQYYTLTLPTKNSLEVYTIVSCMKDAVANFKSMLETAELTYWSDLVDTFLEIYMENGIKGKDFKIRSITVCPSLLGFKPLEIFTLPRKRKVYIPDIEIPDSLYQLADKRRKHYLTTEK